MEQDLLFTGLGFVLGFLIRSAIAKPHKYQVVEAEYKGFEAGTVHGMAILKTFATPRTAEKPVDTETPAYIRKGRQTAAEKAKRHSMEGIR